MTIDELVQSVSRHKSLGMTDAQVTMELSKLLPHHSDDISKAIDVFHSESRKIRMLEDPPTSVDLEGLPDSWYLGPRVGDRFWWPLQALLSRTLPEDSVTSIDRASTKVVSLLAAPGVDDISTRGLVLGYVQSGKTTNFAAVAAKAADAGYRVVIVLAGLHNSLRSQTQERMEEYLVRQNPSDWFCLTSVDDDFTVATGSTTNATLTATEKRVLIIIKKNASRLRALNQWLQRGDPRIVSKIPMLVIDDEADQASIDTSPAEDEEKRSTINKLLVDLLSKTNSAYVGYTATPFANFLIDVSTPEDLYPRHFIIDLPRPAEYFGPEKLFGRELLSEGEDESASDGLDIIRAVPDTEADDLRPKGKKGVAEYVAHVPESLSVAVKYFLMATAARRVRVGESHSTMLVHTSLYSDVQDRQAKAIRAALLSIQRDFVDSDTGVVDHMNAMWAGELQRVPSDQFGLAAVSFAQLRPHLLEVMRECVVKVDNYKSEDRLSYDGGPKTVIVVGGNTLSRGLTLEGLIVSYFIRTSSAYDTLLQMGRWFGYRVGYEDLPRVWLTDELRSQFFDLATVEFEIRMDIARFEAEGRTPLELPVRLRTHPKLLVTSSAKMQYAKDAQVSYSGRRIQTILFRVYDEDFLAGNIAATRDLIRGTVFTMARPGQSIAHDVDVERVIEFLRRYSFDPNAVDLKSDPICEYIRQQTDRDELLKWNIAVLGQASNRSGTVDLGLSEPVNLISRTRVSGTESANIKALLSRPDTVADLDVAEEVRTASWDCQLDIRPHGIGLLMILPIAANSTPKTGSRRPLDAVDDVIGIGLAFPAASHPTTAHTYISAPAIEEYAEEQHPEIEDGGDE